MLYFGRLEPVLRASRGVLSSNGLVVFTVETAEGAERTANGWALGEGGRFVHDATYVARALGESGFESCEVVEEVLRYELGAEVRGLVVTARAVDGTSRS